ncbi:MAG: class A beta-lactamase-related serine hydrolase [Dehalococcoidia bacterium]|nr:class A beta-lactamase-related serine hydrolase [Dehalococcoidia bacterium]
MSRCRRPWWTIVGRFVGWVAGVVVVAILLADHPTVARAEWTVTLLPPVRTIPDATLQAILDHATAEEPAVYGVTVKHLLSGQSASVNGDRIIEAASLYKVALMVDVFRQQAIGAVSLDERLGSWADGADYTLADALEDMITISDNEAAWLALARMGGASAVNPRLAALGLPNTTLEYDTTTTAHEMLRLFEGIATGTIADPESCLAMLTLLLRQQVADRLPRWLPPGTPIAHKTGNLWGLIHDVGVVYGSGGPYVLALLTDEAWDDARVMAVLERITREVDAYFVGQATRARTAPERPAP